MIHAYELHGRYIVLDVESGAVLDVDSAAFSALHTPPELHTAEQAEAWGELMSLKAEGLLFTEPPLESGRDVYSLPQSRTDIRGGPPPLKALCMHVSHDCNLRCGYCFAHTGDFGTGKRSVMPPEVAEKAVDYLLERCGGRENLEIDFFGGEPLMAFDTVKHTVAYAKKRAPGKRFRFTLTTNGVLLDEETIAYLNAEMDNLVLSLDGRKDVNDACRGRTYDSLLPKYKRVIETRTGDYYVRGTYTNRNLDFAEDVLHLASLGFRNISLEPAILPPGHPLALGEGCLPALNAEYEKLCGLMADGADFSFFHFNVDLEQGPCVYKRLRGCGAGVEYAAVTPEGDVFPCHQFAGREAYRLGSVLDGSFRDDLSARFMSMNCSDREDCAVCRAKYFCGGGCAAANLTVNGDIHKADRLGCELAKKRLDCAIYLKSNQVCE
ncbi:MAG: thioether cross-link-forming SCIFF peptide maturase [Oscillospiraceae bacterium]|nr:thioether cross-link-forming SCIFF peptide maturase [Oscillospiraceae bacterium]